MSKGNRRHGHESSLLVADEHGTPTPVVDDAELLRVSRIESTRNLYHVG